MTVSPDPIRALLQHLGCAPAMVHGGVAGLLDRWEAFTAEVRAGYGFELDTYLTDLDTRRILHEVLTAGFDLDGAQASRLAAADARFRAGSVPSETCVWGAVKAAAHGWTATEHWWSFAKPKKSHDEFEAAWSARIGP